MKQTTPEGVTVCGKGFHIFPFSAFVAANLSAEVLRIVMPVLGALAPLAVNVAEDGNAPAEDTDGRESVKKAGILDRDIDFDRLGPALANVFAGVSGDEVETVLRKLLTTYGNISYEDERGNSRKLTEDDAGELFCGEPYGLFILAFHVARVNYSGFFSKMPGLYGNQMEGVVGKVMETVKTFPGMANLT